MIRSFFCVALLLGVFAAGPVAGQCTPDWDPNIGDPGTDGIVYDFARWEDPTLGLGAMIYAAGEFLTAGGATVNRVTRLEGGGFFEVGAGIASSSVRALEVWDDAQGGPPLLYLCGQFGAPYRLARYDGVDYTDLGGQMGASAICYDIAAHDDGAGTRLYIAGQINARALNVIAYDPVADAYASLDGGCDSVATTVHSHPTDGLLYASGFFSNCGQGGANPIAVNRLAAWDGNQWQDVGGGTNGFAFDLETFDDDLIIGGSFSLAGGSLATNNVCAWDGTQFIDLGGGVNGLVNALAVWDDGTGEALYVGGDFDMAGGVPANNIAKWDGSSWSALGDGVDDAVTGLGVGDDDGDGNLDLYVGGSFTTAGTSASAFIAKYIGCPATMGAGFIRGDCDGDNMFNGLIDTLFLLAFQFQGGPMPPCLEAADADGDGSPNGLVDGLFILNFQFGGGPTPPPPSPPNCGVAPQILIGCATPTC